jgi:hypothetical protein
VHLLEICCVENSKCEILYKKQNACNVLYFHLSPPAVSFRLFQIMQCFRKNWTVNVFLDFLHGLLENLLFKKKWRLIMITANVPFYRTCVMLVRIERNLNFPHKILRNIQILNFMTSSCEIRVVAIRKTDMKEKIPTL